MTPRKSRVAALWEVLGVTLAWRSRQAFLRAPHIQTGGRVPLGLQSEQLLFHFIRAVQEPQSHIGGLPAADAVQPNLFGEDSRQGASRNHPLPAV